DWLRAIDLTPPALRWLRVALASSYFAVGLLVAGGAFFAVAYLLFHRGAHRRRHRDAENRAEPDHGRRLSRSRARGHVPFAASADSLGWHRCRRAGRRRNDTRQSPSRQGFPGRRQRAIANGKNRHALPCRTSGAKKIHARRIARG